MEKSCREVRAENSEFKAKQLMSAFQGQGGTGIPSLSAMASMNESAEIQKLKGQISAQTNEILQLNEDKQELMDQIDDLKTQVLNIS